MTELTIPAPPAKPHCAQCLSSLVWLYSASKETWVAFVPCACGARYSLHPHPCRHAQDPRIWRTLPTGDPPSAEYVEWKQNLKSSNEKEDG